MEGRCPVILVAEQIADAELGGEVAWAGVRVRDGFLAWRYRLESRPITEVPPTLVGAGGDVMKCDSRTLGIELEVGDRLGRLDELVDKRRGIHHNRPRQKAAKRAANG